MPLIYFMLCYATLLLDKTDYNFTHNNGSFHFGAAKRTGLPKPADVLIAFALYLFMKNVLGKLKIIFASKRGANKLRFANNKII